MGERWMPTICPHHHLTECAAQVLSRAILFGFKIQRTGRLAYKAKVGSGEIEHAHPFSDPRRIEMESLHYSLIETERFT